MKLFSCLLVTLVAIVIPNGVHSQTCLADDIGKGSFNYKAGTLYKGQTIFTANFLDALNKASPNENLFFSPYSLYHALLLAYFGSANQTEKALKEVLNLHWAKDKTDVFKGYKFEQKTREHYLKKNSSVEFSSVDKFYFANEVQLNPCIEDIIVDETEKLDFSGKPEASLQKINEFVNQATKGNIPQLLNQGDITSSTKVVLANAAYFKGAWASKFNADNTKKEIFYTSQTKRDFVDMMSKSGSYNHAANERLGCHVLEIPYVKSEKVNINMIVFLPPSVPEGLEMVLSKLTPEALHEALQDGFEREVELKFPKFSTEKTIELSPILARMNVGDLFQSSANLSGFSNTTKLFLDDAIQKAKITVDEEGSTAAAATALFSFRSSRPAEPAQFFCDHPFLYMIYDQNTRAVLFAGIYRGPEKN